MYALCLFVSKVCFAVKMSQLEIAQHFETRSYYLFIELIKYRPLMQSLPAAIHSNGCFLNNYSRNGELSKMTQKIT